MEQHTNIVKMLSVQRRRIDVKYIMISEDGEAHKSEEVTDGDKDACDIGILEVIDTENMTTYYEGEWHEIPVWTTG